MKKLTVYLAGPDVFYADSKQCGEALQTLCARYGFHGMYPLDNELQPDGDEPLSVRIAKANETLVKEADVVLANLSAFRGAEPDSGTVCEVVMASMLGKPVYAYMPDAGSSMAQRVHATHGAVSYEDGVPTDTEGNHVENFGDVLNLMLRRHVKFSATDPALCLKQMAIDLLECGF